MPTHQPLRCRCSRPWASGTGGGSCFDLQKHLPVQSHAPRRCDQTWRPVPETRPLRTQIEQRTMPPPPTSNMGAGRKWVHAQRQNCHNTRVLPQEHYPNTFRAMPLPVPTRVNDPAIKIAQITVRHAYGTWCHLLLTVHASSRHNIIVGLEWSNWNNWYHLLCVMMGSKITFFALPVRSR